MLKKQYLKTGALAFGAALGMTALAGSLLQGATGLPRASATSEIGNGLNTTVFQTPAGTIRVNLPEDMAASDTISGTVIATAQGNTPEEIAQAKDELSGYVVEVRNTKPEPTRDHPVTPNQPTTCGPGQPFTCTLPATIPSGTPWRSHPPVDVVLVDSKTGTNVCDHPVDVPDKPTTKNECPPGACSIPETGQTGHPIDIKTACDGKSENSGVSVGDQPCTVLAESPRSMVAESPKNVVGPTNITVKDQNRTATSTFTNLAVKLSSPKTILKKGEKSTVTVTVYGLQGCTSPVTLKLENLSSETIDLEGGNEQVITINKGYSL